MSIIQYGIRFFRIGLILLLIVIFLRDRPLQQTAVPVSLTASSSVKIMTFNIHHGKGLDGRINIQRIIGVLAQEKADIIVLQEVDRYQLRSGMVDQAQEIARGLAMNYCFSASLTAGFGEYGNMILSKHPILEHQAVRLPGIREDRSLLSAVISIHEQEVTILATHLGVRAQERKQHMSLVLGAAAQLQGPTIIAGDFNMRADDVLLKEFIEYYPSAQFSDSLSKAIPFGEIDLLFSNLSQVGFATALPTRSSDHFPVIARFRLNSGVQV
ncbi:hypothetical protein D3C73_706040 [compost metagenome]